MTFCSQCGKILDQEGTLCPYCGYQDQPMFEESAGLPDGFSEEKELQLNTPDYEAESEAAKNRPKIIEEGIKKTPPPSEILKQQTPESGNIPVPLNYPAPPSPHLLKEKNLAQGNGNFIENWVKVLITALIILVPCVGPVAGIIGGAIMMNHRERDYRSFGISILVLGIIMVLMTACCCFMLLVVEEAF